MKPKIDKKAKKLKLLKKTLKNGNATLTKLSLKKRKVPSLKSEIKSMKISKNVDNQNVVHKFIAEKRVKTPLPNMLSCCKRKIAPISDPDFKVIFEPKVIPKTCKIHGVDYKLPKANEDAFEVEISEMDSDDLGSLVSSEEEEQFVFIEEKVGRYKTHSVPNGCIVLLYENSKLFLHGLMQANILHGSVDILGKHLDKMSPPAMVYSPRGSALLSIVNRNIEETSEDTSRKLLKKQLMKTGLDSSICHDIVTFKMKSNMVIIHCLNVMDKATEFLEANLAQKIYPKFHGALRCKFKNITSQEWNIVQVSNEWTQLVNIMNSFSTEINPKDDNFHKNENKNVNKLMLCGGNGVGKSTLLRYLTNQLLNTQGVVYILDLDPGQPEFTVPGAISLVRVTSPLLGPNYTHLQQTEKSIFVSNINISADHESYLECVRKLVSFVNTLKLTNVPMLVNYMGFTKGIGLFLTAEVLRLLQVDVVVQIESLNESRNFDVDLTPDVVRQQLGESNNCAIKRPENRLKNYKLMKIDSVTTSEGNDAVRWVLEPRQVREMCIFAYISRVLPSQCRFLTEKDVPIYQTQLDEVNIIYNGKLCDVGAANANIVALCEEDPSVCLGWGIVRGVCTQTNRLFLLTPLEVEQMDNVKNIVVGTVTLPPSIYLRHHDAIRGVVPYTFKGALSNFAKSPKRNMVPKRAA